MAAKKSDMNNQTVKGYSKAKHRENKEKERKNTIIDFCVN